MKKIKCVLNLPKRLQKEDTGHVSQIVTGFMMLKKQGVIELEVKYSEECPFISTVEAIINNKIRIMYDIADGYNNFSNEKVIEYANKSDFYFKRSYNKHYNSKYHFTTCIYPLGFNYHVTIAGNILDRPIGENLFDTFKWYFKELTKRNYHQDFYVDNFEDTPKEYDFQPSILFTTRTWSDEFPEEGKYDIKCIDEMRAECIRKLRKEFGNNFIGGFSNRDFAKRNYPDCILDASVTNRINFLKQIKKADICITTIGLHESNGWKLGEYVAASKAIVTEKLIYSVPGNFCNGRNYLEFSNSDQCVENTKKLVEDKDLMYSMKINNYKYYQEFLRPDKLIFNSLMIACR